MQDQPLGRAWRSYYQEPAVRDRLREYLGGASLAEATAVYVTTGAPSLEEGFEPRPVGELWQILDRQSEAARSLWDRRSLLVHLDLEHVHFDRPWQSYQDPKRCFELQRPLVARVRQLLGEHGIAPLHLLTGRGHHFIWRVERQSPVLARLAEIGRMPPSLARLYAEPQLPLGEVVEPQLGAAYAGLGRVMEYFGHELLTAAADTPVPLQLTAVEAGPVDGEREIVSIDLSEYGDPLHTRMTRLPFTAYLKAQRLQPFAPSPLASALGPRVTVPLTSIDEAEGLRVMHDLEAAAELARSTDLSIPEASAPMASLVDAYRASALARFHHRYDHFDGPLEPPLTDLPPCAQRLLDHPNDLLLKPAGIQHLVRVLLALGWHPQQITALIRSKYRQDHGWIQDLHFHETACRAEFYTRLFAGLVASGRDGLVDFNCRSAQEKRYCETDPCGQSLTPFRDSLTKRREHGRLASGPFNRLLL